MYHLLSYCCHLDVVFYCTFSGKSPPLILLELEAFVCQLRPSWLYYEPGVCTCYISDYFVVTGWAYCSGCCIPGVHQIYVSK